MKRSSRPTAEVFQRLRNRLNGDVVITSNMFPKRFGDYGLLIRAFEEHRPDRKFWITESAFDKVKI